MNRINPLHIVALLLTLILFLFYQSANAQKRLEEADNAFQEAQSLAVSLQVCKNTFSDKNRVKRAFQRVVLQPLFRQNIKAVYLNDGVKVNGDALNLRVLDAFISKIFNGIYKIEEFQIKTEDNKTASLQMRIAW